MMQGPFEIDLKIHIECGENYGTIRYALTAGKYPAREEIEKAIEVAMVEAKKQFGEGVRLMGREEFTNVLIQERTGTNERFACEDEWDA